MKQLLIALMALGTWTVAQAAQLQIMNEDGQPLAGADVLIGFDVGDPYDGNAMKTDVNGTIEIPVKWNRNLPVTVQAEGYVNATFTDLAPTDKILQLHRQDSRNTIEVRGNTTNFGNLKKDGKVDFALVYPALRKRQLSRFDMESVISSDVDTIQVITESVAIPSNLTLPQQKESYVLPITFDKPTYRMPFRQAGNYRMMATHGQFPLKQVVGDLREGKSFYEVLNYFRYLEAGQRDITVNTPLSGQDIAVNQIPMNRKASVRGPSLSADEVMISFSLVNQGGVYFPADIKRVGSGENVELMLPTSADEHAFVSLLMSKMEAEKIGGSRVQGAGTQPEKEISPLRAVKILFQNFVGLVGKPDTGYFNQGAGGLSLALHDDSEPTPRFLSMVPRPVVSNEKVELTPPQIIEGIEPLATFLVLSEVEKEKNGHLETTKSFRLWEVTQNGWGTEIVLPKHLQNLNAAKNYRWEVLFMGRSTGHNKGSGDYFLDEVTHVSRNSFDF